MTRRDDAPLARDTVSTDTEPVDDIISEAEDLQEMVDDPDRNTNPPPMSGD